MSILKNAPQPELIPTYDGSNQSTHPSVLQFDTPWNGYRFWMAMTPYPFNYDGLEDPSVLASNDTKTWVVPDGLTNPLTPAPKPGHNCDVELVYNKERDELWLYYVEADDIVQSWVKLMRSADGVHWTKPEIVLHDPVQKYSILSPCVQRMRMERGGCGTSILEIRGIRIKATRFAPAHRKMAFTGAQRKPVKTCRSPATRSGT